MTNYYLYGLHRGDGVIRYIGQSINPKRRLRSHRNVARRNEDKKYSHYPLYRWMLKNDPGKIGMTILGEFETRDEVNAAEVAAIAELREKGDCLNIDKGGSPEPPRKPQRTVCAEGHSLTDDNVYVFRTSSGRRRVCKPCHLAAGRLKRIRYREQILKHDRERKEAKIRARVEAEGREYVKDRRLSTEEIALIASLHAEGHTKSEIARRVGCSVPTVTYRLDKFERDGE